MTYVRTPYRSTALCRANAQLLHYCLNERWAHMQQLEVNLFDFFLNTTWVEYITYICVTAMIWGKYWKMALLEFHNHQNGCRRISNNKQEALLAGFRHLLWNQF